MTDRELMQQALDALIKAHPYSNSNKDLDGHSEAITALRERLAQPEQEQWDAIPDAFNEWWDADYDDTGNPYRKDSPAYWAWSGWKAASKQPEQEHVIDCPRCGHCCPSQPEQEPLKIAHKHEWFRTGEMKIGQMRCISCGIWGQEEVPQRKPLTDEEMFKIWLRVPAETEDRFAFARAIEAAHGIGEKK